MHKREFKRDIDARMREAVREILGHSPEGTTITALALWAGLDYGTARAWVDREEEEGRLTAERVARGYRVRKIA